MSVEHRGTKALELWTRRATEGYPGVGVNNMTTSWRDGLAFCALIHHFRPDLIDFKSLKAEHILENNALAFRVAEQHLGIPALLDAEDMLQTEVPDRLSILTYVSQFYQAFNSLGLIGPGGRRSPLSPAITTPTTNIKKTNGASVTGPTTPVKPAPPPIVASPRVKSISQPPATLHTKTETGFKTDKVTVGVRGRREECVACHKQVFLAERIVVGFPGQLRHRTCFRCDRCAGQLTLASYYETEKGQFCCETCPDEERNFSSGDDEEEGEESARKVYTGEEKRLQGETTLDSESDSDSLSHSDSEEEENASQEQSSKESATPPLPSTPRSAFLHDALNTSPKLSPSTQLTAPPAKPPRIDTQSSGYVNNFSRLSPAIRGDSFAPAENVEHISSGLSRCDNDAKGQEICPPADILDTGQNAKDQISNTYNHTKSTEEKSSEVVSKTSETKQKRNASTLEETPTHKVKQFRKLFETMNNTSMEKPTTNVNYSKVKAGVNNGTENTTKPNERSTSYLDESKIKSEVNNGTENTIKPNERLTSHLNDGRVKSKVNQSTENTDKLGERKHHKETYTPMEIPFIQESSPIIASKLEEPANSLPEPTDGPVDSLVDPQLDVDIREVVTASDCPKSDTNRDSDTLNPSSFESSEGDDSSFRNINAEKERAENTEECVTRNIPKEPTESGGEIESVKSPEESKEYNTEKEKENSENTEKEMESAENTESEKESDENMEKFVGNIEKEPIENDADIESVKTPEEASEPDRKESEVLKVEIKQVSEETATVEAESDSRNNSYPGELNPFDADDRIEPEPIEVATQIIVSANEVKIIVDAHPQNLEDDSKRKVIKSSFNPFESDEDEEEEKSSQEKKKSLNPFWSEDESDNDIYVMTPSKSKVKPPRPPPPTLRRDAVPSTRKLILPPSSPYDLKFQGNTAPPSPSLSARSSSSDQSTLRLRKKLRHAPAPPTCSPGQNSPLRGKEAPLPKDESSSSSPCGSSLAIHQPGLATDCDIKDDTFSVKMQKDLKNHTSKMKGDYYQRGGISTSKCEEGEWRRKKGPAPSRPVPQKRAIRKLPMRRVAQELQDIEVKQTELERQGVLLETVIRDRTEGTTTTKHSLSGSTSPDDSNSLQSFSTNSEAEKSCSSIASTCSIHPGMEVEDMILQLFELVNEKNDLFRRQTELMYMKREKRLEEEHAELEFQIRCLMLKTPSEKKEDDVKVEEELIARLLKVVELRDAVVNCLEMERQREAIEDESIATHMIKYQEKHIEGIESDEKPEHVKKKKKKLRLIKKKKKDKEKQHKIDADKDIDETEVKKKKKKAWFKKPTILKEGKG